MKAYRIQQPYKDTLLGIGPYQMNAIDDPVLLREISEMGWDHRGTFHPSMSEDLVHLNSFKHPRIKYHCGCTSLDDLYRWFGRYLDYLLAGGFSIVEYEVSHHLMGLRNKNST